MTDENTGEVADFVPFRTARTPFEARVIAVVLESAGIPAMTPDGMLADEFAASQRLMNLQSVKVLVPRARLAEAEAALAEAKRVGAEMEVDEEGISEPSAAPLIDRKRGGSGHGVLALFFGACSLALLVAWLETKAALAPNVVDPVFTPPLATDHYRYFRADGSLDFETADEDRNGIFERTTCFDRKGRLRAVMIDADQDGVVERAEWYGPDGSLSSVSEDRDQDGRVETVREMRAGDVEIVYRDVDGDGRYESLEVRDASGQVRVTQELDPQRGFVTR